MDGLTGPINKKDFSYEIIKDIPEVMRVEQSIPLDEFHAHFKKRRLDKEFALLNKITDTHKHIHNKVKDYSDLNR